MRTSWRMKGSGIDLARAHLNAACDLALSGELEKAWEALEEAWLRGATAGQIKKAVANIHSCSN